MCFYSKFVALSIVDSTCRTMYHLKTKLTFRICSFSRDLIRLETGGAAGTVILQLLFGIRESALASTG